jgi:hypothetical protein
MAIRIDDDFMSAESAGRVIATARYSEDAAADGHGAWAVSYRPSHLFTRDQAITAMVLAERLAAGYGDDDPFVIGWREELDRCIRITTALAMVAVAVAAAVISYQQPTVRARHKAGLSQRAIARELNIDRRKVKRILDQAA